SAGWALTRSYMDGKGLSSPISGPRVSSTDLETHTAAVEPLAVEALTERHMVGLVGQIVVAGRRVTEPNRFDNRPQVGLNTHLPQHRLDGLGEELVMVEVPHHEIQRPHAALAGSGQQRFRLLDRGTGILLIAQPFDESVLGRGE